jgi:flagellar biosynthesis component FlhA
LPAGARLTGAAGGDAIVVPIAGHALRLVHGDAPADAIGAMWTLALCLFDLLRERAPRLLCGEALDAMYARARTGAPATFTMAVARLGRAGLDALVQELVKDGAPLSDLRTVCQAICERVPDGAPPRALAFGNTAAATGEPGLAALATYVRVRLGARIVAVLTDGEAALRAHVVDAGWTEAALGAMSPAHGERLRAAVRRTSAAGAGGTRWRLVLLVAGAIRARVAELLRFEFPHVAVVAFEEVPAWVEIAPLSRDLGA